MQLKKAHTISFQVKDTIFPAVFQEISKEISIRPINHFIHLQAIFHNEETNCNDCYSSCHIIQGNESREPYSPLLFFRLSLTAS